MNLNHYLPLKLINFNFIEFKQCFAHYFQSNVKHWSIWVFRHYSIIIISSHFHRNLSIWLMNGWTVMNPFFEWNKFEPENVVKWRLFKHQTIDIWMRTHMNCSCCAAFLLALNTKHSFRPFYSSLVSYASTLHSFPTVFTSMTLYNMRYALNVCIPWIWIHLYSDF